MNPKHIAPIPKKCQAHAPYNFVELPEPDEKPGFYQYLVLANSLFEETRFLLASRSRFIEKAGFYQYLVLANNLFEETRFLLPSRSCLDGETGFLLKDFSSKPDISEKPGF